MKLSQKAIMQLTEACPKRPRKPKTLHLTPSEFISIPAFSISRFAEHVR